MDSLDAFEDKEFEQLNDAILKAIISSQDVEKVLQDFKSKKLINYKFRKLDRAIKNFMNNFSSKR